NRVVGGSAMFPVLSTSPRVANRLRVAASGFPAIVPPRRVRAEPCRATLSMGCLAVAIVTVLVGAPPGEGSEVPLAVEKGQEFVYRGIYAETNNRSGLAGTRRFEIEAYVFVLNTGTNGTDAAFLTVLRPAKQGGQETPPTARLELAKVDGAGRIRFSRKSTGPRIPPEGPPALETRAFVEMPHGGFAGGFTRAAAGRGGGPTSWSVGGLDPQP